MCSHREDFIDYSSYDDDSLDCDFEDTIYMLAEEMREGGDGAEYESMNADNE